MTHELQGWTPPPGVAVVDPPVANWQEVDLIFSDRSELLKVRAGSQNWSSVGDGPSIVAYAVVEEYKPAPELREWWFSFGDDDFDDDIVVLHESYAAADDGRRDGYGRICNRREIIHVREAPDPSREVVAWAVIHVDGSEDFASFNLKHVMKRAGDIGGTVVKLSGVKP